MKKTLMRIGAVLVSSVLAMSALAGCGAKNEQQTADKGKTVELKLATHDPSTSENTKMVQTLADETFEATDGRVKITICADASLGPASDGLTMLDTGVCDMIWTTTSLFAGQFPICELMTLPFLGADDVFDLCDSFWDLYEAHPEYFTELDGYVPLGMYSGGRGVFVTNRELSSAADLSGMTMRVVTGPLNMMAQDLGINALTMGPGDIFLSMEKGVIDGYMFNLNGIGSFALYDVTPYAYCFGSSTFDNNILVLMSEDAWGRISDEDKAIIDGIWRRAGSQRMVKVLDDTAVEGEKILGEHYIQIDSGDFYDEMEACANEAVAEYIADFDGKGVPMSDAYAYFLERIESYRD